MGKLDVYVSFSDKSKDFSNSVVIKSREELDDWFENNSKIVNSISRFIFRGVNNASRKNYNSAQRFWKENDLQMRDRNYDEYLGKIVKQALHWQTRLLEKYYNNFNVSLNDLNVFSLLQHYGGPSPLIDFTTSFYRALFFAIYNMAHKPSDDEAENFISVYIIDLKKNSEYILTRKELQESQKEPFSIDTLLKLNKVLIINPNSGVDDEYMKEFLLLRNNLNIINQKGLFVFNKLENTPLMKRQNSSQNNYLPLYIDCLNIHKSLIHNLEGRLPKVISKEHIFPSFELLSENVKKNY